MPEAIRELLRCILYLVTVILVLAFLAVVAGTAAYWVNQYFVFLGT